MQVRLFLFLDKAESTLSHRPDVHLTRRAGAKEIPLASLPLTGRMKKPFDLTGNYYMKRYSYLTYYRQTRLMRYCVARKARGDRKAVNVPKDVFDMLHKQQAVMHVVRQGDSYHVF